MSVKGWVYPRKGDRVKVIVSNSHGEFEFSPNRARPDVQKHLERRYGIDTNVRVGFEFYFPVGEGFGVEYETDGVRLPVLRVEKEKEDPFPRIDTWDELVNSRFGVHGDYYYFRNGFDRRRVMVFFNGRVTAAKLAMDKSIFQRWTWARYFRHPVFYISDPLTVGENAISLAWYLGRKKGELVSLLLAPIIDVIDRKFPGAEIIAFGSSGGGFAALLCAQLGLVDEAIAINPQTDVLLYDDREAVADFVALRNEGVDQTNLFFYGLDRMKPHAKVTYIQNEADVSHLVDHMTPYRNFVDSSRHAGKFRFVNFFDERIGHAPPDFYDIKKIMRDSWERFCV
ncbi:hypothetical protein [Burkholderia multivorans]|uniref:hypothetical protein n=1 Tax=Burkholderia multivorans TaxID=87883 RepID=UPI001C242432|nr:hypothetical protein [Burkholderia multivorans]MBU9478466.1 hypothetical protein [Burkholderia multivorans]